MLTRAQIAAAGLTSTKFEVEFYATPAEQVRICLQGDTDVCLRAPSTAGSQAILGQSGGDRSAWYARCAGRSDAGVLPPGLPPAPPTPPPPYGDGGAWYLSAKGGNCDTTCSLAGLVCNLDEFRAHVSDFDTKAKYIAEVDTIREHHRGTTDIPNHLFNCQNGHRDNADFAGYPAINRGIGRCFTTPPAANPPAHTCARAVAISWQRLCRYSQPTPHEPTSHKQAPTPTPTRCSYGPPSAPPPSPAPAPPPPSPPPPSPPPPSPPPPGEPRALEHQQAPTIARSPLPTWPGTGICATSVEYHKIGHDGGAWVPTDELRADTKDSVGLWGSTTRATAPSVMILARSARPSSQRNLLDQKPGGSAALTDCPTYQSNLYADGVARSTRKHLPLHSRLYTGANEKGSLLALSTTEGECLPWDGTNPVVAGTNDATCSPHDADEPSCTAISSCVYRGRC